MSRINIINDNYNIISTPYLIANSFAEYFSGISATENYNIDFFETKIRTEQNILDFSSPNDEIYNSPFTEWELDRALKSTKNTSPGPDKIQNLMLKKLKPSFLKDLLEFHHR